MRQRTRHQALTRRKIREYVAHHTVYELIPESGRVVLIDLDLPLPHALHALHEQGLSSAPVYDSQLGRVVGMISSSDFIQAILIYQQGQGLDGRALQVGRRAPVCC